MVLNDYIEYNKLDHVTTQPKNDQNDQNDPPNNKNSSFLSGPGPDIDAIEVLGADDFLPLLTWVLIHSDIPNVCELMEMLQAYIQTVGCELGELEYFANNICTAIHVIINEPFERYHQYFK
jgi:hypothetical protein